MAIKKTSLGKALGQVRRALNLSQSDIAPEIGVSRQQLAFYELELAYPTKEHYQQWVEALFNRAKEFEPVTAKQQTYKRKVE